MKRERGENLPSRSNSIYQVRSSKPHLGCQSGSAQIKSAQDIDILLPRLLAPNPHSDKMHPPGHAARRVDPDGMRHGLNTCCMRLGNRGDLLLVRERVLLLVLK